MGCELWELQDILTLLKNENSYLEDEKEKLLSDQIHICDDKKLRNVWLIWRKR